MSSSTSPRTASPRIRVPAQSAGDAPRKSAARRWPLVRLGDVLQLQRRWFTPVPAQMYVEIGVRSFGKGIFHKTPISGLDLGSKRVLRIEPGDLVLNNVFAWEGAVAVASESEAGTVGSHRFITLTSRDGVCDVRCLQLYFQTEAGRELLGRASPGSAGRNRTLGIDRFLDQVVSLPPLPEQRRIVAKIERLAAKIEEARGLQKGTITGLDSLSCRAIDTALEGCQEYDAPALGMLLREPSRNGLSARPSDDPPGLPILRISAGTSRADGVVDENDYKLLDVTAEVREAYSLVPGDLLACRFNGNLHYVGRFSLFRGEQQEPRLYPDKLIRFRADTTKVMPEFVRLVMNSSYGRTQIEKFCQTTAGNIGISAAHLNTIPVPLPPLPQQHCIVARLDNLQGKLARLKAQLAQTAAQIDAMLRGLLEAAFKGAP
jgi:type I restriction enzyme, S subunit